MTAVTLCNGICKNGSFCKDLICAICLCDLTSLPQNTTSCGHSFHTDCLSMWTSKHQSCPLCRCHVDNNNLDDPNVEDKDEDIEDEDEDEISYWDITVPGFYHNYGYVSEEDVERIHYSVL